MKVSLVTILAVLTATSLSAHIMVSPPESKTGATQRYELRVHNEGKIAVASVQLEIPDGVTVTDVAKPAAGTFVAAKMGTRITSITWTIDVLPEKYLALPFTAINPAGAGDVKWNVHEHLAGGSVVEWTDKPGAAEKNSVTKLTAAVAASAPAMSMQAAKPPMSDADYAKTMKDINPTFQSLTRDNSSMNHAQGEKDAQKLSDLFKDVQAYWEAKKTADAVEFSKAAVAAADATVKASASMDMTTLTTAQQKLSASCTGCHMAHRDKLPDGSYKIK